MLDDLAKRMLTLEQRLDNLIRVGVVVGLKPDDAMVRVGFKDVDGITSAFLPVLFQKSKDDKHYVMPDMGQQVLCVFLPIGHEIGFVLGSFYSKADLPPDSSNDKYIWQFKDGTIVEYDRETHQFNLNSVGEINLTAADSLKINSSLVEINADTLTKITTGKVEVHRA